jgi:site-specific recombinase XerC
MEQQHQPEPQQQSEEKEIMMTSQKIGSRNKKPVIYPVTEGARSPQTRDKYRRNFNRFLDYIQIHDLQVLIDLGPKVIQEMIIKYLIEMRDLQNKKRSTINGQCTAILHFLDMNDIEVNRHKIKRHLPYDESTRDDRPYTTKEIQKMLSTAGDLRDRAMILLMASSGVRIGALSSMQIGDLTPGVVPVIIIRCNLVTVSTLNATANTQHL